MELATGVSRQHRHPPRKRDAARRDPAPERLQHRGLRQVPRDAALGSLGVRARIDRWPTGSGFDKFYGFIGGETNQWAPAIFDGVTRVEHAQHARLSLHDGHDRPGDQLGQRAAVAHARQAVLHVLRDRRDARAAPRRRRNGSTSTRASSPAAGTSCARRRSRARRRWASFPRTRKLTPRPKEIPAWDDMSADQKRLFERQMETFAGFAEHTDYEVGRLVAQLEAHRRARQHALLLHRRRQRLERRRRAGRHATTR